MNSTVCAAQEIILNAGQVESVNMKTSKAHFVCIVVNEKGESQLGIGQRILLDPTQCDN